MGWLTRTLHVAQVKVDQVGTSSALARRDLVLLDARHRHQQRGRQPLRDILRAAAVVDGDGASRAPKHADDLDLGVLGGDDAAAAPY